MSDGRAGALAPVVASRRLVGAEREHAAYDTFCARHGIAPSPHAVTLYLTDLLAGGLVHGRGLRYRLQLLDLHARVAGEPVPSADQDLRRYLRGLHREASLASPERGVEPMHTEVLHAVLDAVARPLRDQVRDAALLLLADATGLPDRVLAGLRWDHVRFLRRGLQVTVPPSGRRPARLVDVAATGGRACPLKALLAWRREAGPVQQPVFGMDGAQCDVNKARRVLRLLGPAGHTRAAAGAAALGPMLNTVLAPRPRAVRDRALLLVAFAAALGTDDARLLRQDDVRRSERGLLVRVAGRADEWTAVPAARAGGPCPAAAWADWHALLASRGLTGPDSPAFTVICGTVVKPQAIGQQGLNLLVHQACERGGLRGDWSFTSLRSGFVRSAIRAGAPDHVVARQAGLVLLKSVSTHANREHVIRRSAAGLVGL